MRYLLIDAHNVIHATDRLRELFLNNQDAARDKLAESAVWIHDADGLRVALVMDSKHARLEVEHPFKKKTFEYLYAPAELTADGVIERILRRARAPEAMTVVSNDNFIRESTRACGGIVLRPEEFFEWARACEKRLEQDTIRRNSANELDFRNGIDIEL